MEKERKLLKVIGENNVKRLADWMMPRYYSLVKSEEVVKEILEDNGCEYHELLNPTKTKYESFLKYLEVEGMDDFVDSVDYSVSIHDVVDRLDEQAAHEIQLLEDEYNSGSEEYAYLDIGVVIYDLIKKYERIKEDYILANKGKQRRY